MNIVNKIKRNSSGAHACPSCGESYNKKDFDVCPRCGGDGGGVMKKAWKPTKRQKKEYAKTINSN